jgi:mannosyl-oligosaccharide alpha-1,2-mannosidase
MPQLDNGTKVNHFLALDSLRDDYNASISGVKNLLVRHSKPNNLLFVGELINGNDFKAKMDHLLCFLPGTLALGVHYGMPKEHLRLAEDLLYTCYQTYAAQPTHLAPEITYFNEVSQCQANTKQPKHKVTAILFSKTK